MRQSVYETRKEYLDARRDARRFGVLLTRRNLRTATPDEERELAGIEARRSAGRSLLRDRMSRGEKQPRFRWPELTPPPSPATQCAGGPDGATSA